MTNLVTACRHFSWKKRPEPGTWHSCLRCQVLGQPLGSGEQAVVVMACCTWCTMPATDLSEGYAACLLHADASLSTLSVPAIE